MRISIESLSHTFYNGQATPALQNINLTFESGKFVALIGPSGCGKSTLLRLMANLITPTQGIIHYNGHDSRQAVLDGEIAWLSQSPALLPWLNVEKNLELAQRFTETKSPSRLSISDALALVGLTAASHQYPFTLSGGMQQRLALARVLLQHAPVWLMDDPFAALDELTRKKLTEELLQIWQVQMPAVFWVTHNIYEAIKLADRILVFSPQPGRIAADFSVEMPYPRHENQPQFQGLLSNIRLILQQKELKHHG